MKGLAADAGPFFVLVLFACEKRGILGVWVVGKAYGAAVMHDGCGLCTFNLKYARLAVRYAR